MKRVFWSFFRVVILPLTSYLTLVQTTWMSFLGCTLYIFNLCYLTIYNFDIYIEHEDKFSLERIYGISPAILLLTWWVRKIFRLSLKLGTNI